jgi:hypothetical protein
MNVGAVTPGAGLPAHATTGGSGWSPGPRGTAMDAIRGALGTSVDDMRSAIRSGQGLAGMAAAKGQTPADLVTAVGSALEQAHPGISADSATATATRLVDRLMDQHPGRTAPSAAAPRPTGGGSRLDVSA